MFIQKASMCLCLESKYVCLLCYAENQFVHLVRFVCVRSDLCSEDKRE